MFMILLAMPSSSYLTGVSGDPVYLCVLPDSDLESCSVDLSSESNTVDTTDAALCTVDTTRLRPKKFLCKELSGTLTRMHHI